MDDNYTFETRFFGALMKPYGAITIVPITHDNIYLLNPGDWIWDDKLIERREHERYAQNDTVIEPIGFRQIHRLDLGDFAKGLSSKPFMLSDFDSDRGGYNWVSFEENRFFMCDERG